jgi:hypothetical protein
MKRIRDLAIACAKEYLMSRERLGFPLLAAPGAAKAAKAGAQEVARG